MPFRRLCSLMRDGVHCEKPTPEWEPEGGLHFFSRAPTPHFLPKKYHHIVFVYIYY